MSGSPRRTPVRRALGIALMAVSAAWRAAIGQLRPPAEPPAVPAAEPQPAAERRRLRLLLVCPYSVHPMVHGGAVRLGNLIRRLADQVDIHLFLFVGGTDDPQQREALAPFCRRIDVQRRPPRLDADPWGWRPDGVRAYGDPRIADRLRALVSAHRIDVVQLEYTELGQYCGPYPEARVVLTEHDLSFRSHRRQHALGLRARYGDQQVDRFDDLRRFHHELAVCRRVDQVHCMSAADGRVLAGLLPDGARRLRVVPNGVDVEGYRPPPPEATRQGVLFVGSFPHLPNRDALDYLVDEVWPLIRRRRADAGLTVAGARPPPAVLALDGREGIEVVGEVPALAPLYRRHRLLVVPVRAGSGTRLKILEALACGLPVVSTTVGAEGIPLRAGADLLLADTPESMADAVARVLDDDALAVRLGVTGRRVAEQLGWGPIAATLLAYLETLAGSRQPAQERPAAGVSPEISVIVTGGWPSQACFAWLERQQLERQVETLIMVEAEVPGTSLATADATVVEAEVPGTSLTTDAGIRVLRYEASSSSVHDVGAARARGQVLVFLDAAAQPVDEHWLARLTAPFFASSPPSAVQGGIHERLWPGAPQHWLWSTREIERWREAHGGVVFSLVNAAVRRDVWASQPFGPAGALVDRRWQWRVTDEPYLILPCLDAEVFYTRTWGARDLWRLGIGEGRGWRQLNVRYRFRDLLGDLLQPALFGPGSRLRAWRRMIAGGGSERWLPWLRPLALWLGNLWPGRAS